MRILVRLRSLWWNLLRRERVERALDEELRAYVDLLAAEYERKGLSPEQARRAALVETGGIEQVKEVTRDAWVGNAFATASRELRYALRSLRRSPAFMVIAVATLAIGIGGATAVFTVIKGSLLRPLPSVPEPERLVDVEQVQSSKMIAEFSWPDYRDLHTHSTALAGLAAYNGTSMALEDTLGSTRAWVSYVSDDFFTVLGVPAAMGRLFGSGDAAAHEGSGIAVLGYALWQHRFGGAPTAVGSTFRLDGHEFTVVGVAPKGFVGAMARHPMEIFIPIVHGGELSPVAYGFELESRRSSWVRLVGRLAPGKSAQDAQRDLASIAASLEATYATNKGRTVQVFAGAGMTREERAEMSRIPRLLAMAVALLLLIACGNVAGLSLVRAAVRRREHATRIALGASHAAVVRQVALEGAVLAAAAGALGIVIAQALVRSTTLVRTVVSISDPDLSIDGRVLAVALVSSTLTAILVSLLPAMQLLQLPPGAVLKDGGGGALRRRTVQRALVSVQVGASVILLAAAAIVFNTFQRILRAHETVDPGGLTYALLDVEASLPDSARQLAFYREVLARLAVDPDIGGAALTSSVPPLPWSMRASIFRRGEEPPREALVSRELELGVRVNAIAVSPQFFDIMRIPVARGRAFTTSDDERAAPVAIVSRRLANQLWPGQDPIGQFVSWPAVEGPARAPLLVIGVAADTRDVSLTGDPPLAMYLPFAQHLPGNLVLAVRARGLSPVTATTFSRLVAEVSSNVAVLGARTLRDQLRSEMRPQRTASAWIGVFGALALLLASIGLYGVVAQGVLQRTRELAVRSALGASPLGILANVLGDGMRIAAVGGITGVFGAIVALRILRSMFAGVRAVDLQLAAVTVAVLALAMLAASYLPARRATRINLVDALRAD